MPILRTKNEDFFKKWSPEMAYVLGFFVADGNMNRDRYLEFTSADIEVLEKIKSVLSSANKISTRTRNGKVHYRMQICSEVMFNDLTKLGLTPRKSKTIKFPNVPKEYLGHFLRGYFDGDGHVSEYERKDRDSRIILTGFTSGSRAFIQELYRTLKKEAVVTRGTEYYSGRGYRLCFSVKDSLKLYKYMYDSSGGLFLSRKRSIFEHYFNNILGP